MDTEKLICKFGYGCMCIFFGSLAVGFLACAAALIYLIVCVCGGGWLNETTLFLNLHHPYNTAMWDSPIWKEIIIPTMADWEVSPANNRLLFKPYLIQTNQKPYI